MLCCVLFGTIYRGSALPQKENSESMCCFSHRLIGEEGEKLASKIGPVSVAPCSDSLIHVCVYPLIDAERSLHLPSEGEQYVAMSFACFSL